METRHDATLVHELYCAFPPGGKQPLAMSAPSRRPLVPREFPSVNLGTFDDALMHSRDMSLKATVRTVHSLDSMLKNGTDVAHSTGLIVDALGRGGEFSLANTELSDDHMLELTSKLIMQVCIHFQTHTHTLSAPVQRPACSNV